MSLRGVTLALCFMGVAACGWFGDDEIDPLEPAELVKFKPELRIKRDWSATVGQGLGRKFLKLSPVVVADRIIAADGYGIVEARDRFSGRRVWRTRIGKVDQPGFWNIWDRRDYSFVCGGVGAGGGMVLLGTTEGNVVALSASDGAERWRISVGSEVLSRPVVSDGLVFVQTIDGRLVAIEHDGSGVRWSYDNQEPVLTLRGTSTPVVAGSVVYAGFANGMVAAVRAENGEPIWEQRVMLPQGRSELERIVDVDAAPLVNGRAVYAVSYQGRLRAFRLSDGAPFWEQTASSYVDMAEGYGNVYVVNEDGEILAMDQTTSDIVWSDDVLHRRGLTAPVAFSNYLAVADQEGYLHVFAQSDGRLLARRKVDGDGVRANMVVADEILYVLGNSGHLEALEFRVR